jgi:hypothetical protein
LKRIETGPLHGAVEPDSNGKKQAKRSGSPERVNQTIDGNRNPSDETSEGYNEQSPCDENGVIGNEHRGFAVPALIRVVPRTMMRIVV